MERVRIRRAASTHHGACAAAGNCSVDWTRPWPPCARGDADGAIELAETLRSHGITWTARVDDRKRATPILLDYVREKLTRDPSLTQERYAGRTLLHAASAAGSLTMVELLLRLGRGPQRRGRRRTHSAVQRGQ